MGLEEILANIERDTKAKVAQIAEEAEKAAEREKQEAEKRADTYNKHMQQKAQSDTSRLLSRELSRANIEARKIYSEALEGTINRTLDSVRESLEDYAESADYPVLLNKLAQSASKELGGDCIIYVQKRDMPKLKKGKGADPQEAKEEFIGGLKGVSKDGKLSTDYTLENIFSQIREDMAVQILGMIKKG
jgi:vacuolar-type H+-ATPase subunit E/Vma4